MKKDEIQQGFDFDSRRQNSDLPKFKKRTKEVTALKNKKNQLHFIKRKFL